MRFFTVLLAVFSFAAAHGPASGQDLPLAKDSLPPNQIEQAERHAGGKSVFDDPLGGIVVNRTVTVLGNDFYQYFAAYWREKDISSTFTISVHERPSARFGSEIWVQFRQKRMFHTFLRSEEHTSELQSLMRISYAVFCLKKTKTQNTKNIQ